MLTEEKDKRLFIDAYLMHLSSKKAVAERAFS